MASLCKLHDTPDTGDQALLGLRQHVLQRVAALMEQRLDLPTDTISPLRFDV